jgi:hypothetical protein
MVSIAQHTTWPAAFAVANSDFTHAFCAAPRYCLAELSAPALGAVLLRVSHMMKRTRPTTKECPMSSVTVDDRIPRIGMRFLALAMPALRQAAVPSPSVLP